MMLVSESISSWQFWRKKRYIIAILSFFGTFNIYLLRANLSIALVDMTTIKNVTDANGTIIQKRDFEWDSITQGYILSSFFYGYMLTQILGGYLGFRFGGAKIFGTGVGSTALFTVITPWVAHWNVYLLITIRAVEGFFEGIIFAAILDFWSKWAPPLEKSRLVSITFAGMFLAMISAMPLCAILAAAFSWEYIFYASGGLSIIWYIIWTLVVRESPAEDSRLNLQELKYITESLKKVKSEEIHKIPWLKIATSPPVWAISLAQFCESWGMFNMMTFFPQMMKSALDFDLTQTGFLAGLPYVTQLLSLAFGGFIADWLLKNRYMTLTNIRKLLVFLGFTGQCVFVLCVAQYLSPVTVPIFLTLGMSLDGMATSSLTVNPLDLAPQFAGIIYGINNTFGSLSGIISPILTGYIVRDLTSIDQWRIVFYITSGIYGFGTIFNLIFTSGEIQPWAVNTKEKDNLS